MRFDDATGPSAIVAAVDTSFASLVLGGSGKELHFLVLIAFLSADARFLILAISQQRIRLPVSDPGSTVSFTS